MNVFLLKLEPIVNCILKMELEIKIKEALNYFKEQLAAIRGNKPTPKLVEDILADSYGAKMPIKQLASIAIVLPREIQITPWDRQNIQSIAKAVESSNLNVSANINGNLIRINLPSLSQERREEIIKIVKKESEKTRIKIRHLRDEANKEINRQEESGEITKDQKFKTKDKIQKSVDAANKEIETTLEKKIKEIIE